MATELSNEIKSGYRDQTMDILKGIGIILMVIGHSGTPLWMHDMIYTFHMPLFFIASGWFFKEKCIDAPWDYTKHKLKGIYVPYVKWCLVFLALHNVLYYFGITNQEYGVQKFYHLRDYLLRLFNIIFLMNGHDRLINTFWFMRALFVGSLAICIGAYALNKIFQIKKHHCILLVSILSFVLGLVIAYYRLHIPVIPHNGYREMMATFFVGMGFCIQRKVDFLSKFSLLIAVIFVLFAIMHPTAMMPDMSFVDWLVLPITGLTGFLLVYKISKWLSAKDNKVNRVLTYIGHRTFYIMTFHFLMFKPASYLKACMLGMDWHVVGYVPVIPPDGDKWYWVVYVITSIGLSLVLEKMVSRIHMPKLSVKRS